MVRETRQYAVEEANRFNHCGIPPGNRRTTLARRAQSR
jgi:hypothetical protein